MEAPAEEAAKAPEAQSNDVPEAAKAPASEFSADISDDERIERIARAAKNLETFGFNGAVGLIQPCCLWMRDIEWCGTYVDGEI